MPIAVNNKAIEDNRYTLYVYRDNIWFWLDGPDWRMYDFCIAFVDKNLDFKLQKHNIIFRDTK